MGRHDAQVGCETGLLVGEPWEGEGGRIWALALSLNGHIIACGRDDTTQELTVWH